MAPRLRIVGSGPVALACALFAMRQGFAAADIDLVTDPAPVPEAVGRRVLAVSLGSWQLLSRIASMPRAEPIGTVDVTVLGHPGRTRMSASELGVSALGHVLRYADLLDALRHACDAAGLMGERGSARAVALTHDVNPDRACIIIHAEGDTGEDASVLQFDQTALLADVGISRDHGGTAYECFTAHGPLALLPLPEARRCSLVWCAPPEQTRRRAALPRQALAAELQSHFGWALGHLSIESTALVWPMARRARRRLAQGNEAWIGNAAQALHPVAGQGLNLGLRDAFLLAQVLGQAHAGGRPLELALDRYESLRRTDRQGTIALTDTLARAFSFAPARPLQSALLAWLQTVPAARSGLARQFMFGLR